MATTRRPAWRTARPIPKRELLIVVLAAAASRLPNDTDQDQDGTPSIVMSNFLIGDRRMIARPPAEPTPGLTPDAELEHFARIQERRARRRDMASSSSVSRRYGAGP